MLNEVFTGVSETLLLVALWLCGENNPSYRLFDYLCADY